MELSAALASIKLLKKFPAEEINCIRENKEDAIPKLLECLKYTKENFIHLPNDYNEHIAAMYLLAEFEVKEAFEYLHYFLTLTEDELEWLIGDILTEEYSAILASTATADDIEKLKQIANNKVTDDFIRATAVDTLTLLYGKGLLSRENLISYLKEHMEDNKNNDTYLSLLVNSCLEIKAHELYDDIETFFDNELIDEFLISYADFSIEKKPLKEAILIERLNANSIVDTMKALSKWPCFRKKPEKLKVGRNDPCPCGSGKKYKKCCLDT